MNLLVVSYRAPGLHLRGDQARLELLLRELAPSHRITLVTTQDVGAPPTGGSSPIVIRAGFARRVISAAGFALRGRPLQTGWSMPGNAWRVAKTLASDVDVALIVTSRSLRGPLPCPLVVDHVDALSVNMRQRSRTRGPLVERLAAAVEAHLLARWERHVADWSKEQIVTSRGAAAALSRPPEPHVIPAAWDGWLFEEPVGHVRDIDCVFTGDMRYPPNREAALWLNDEVLPRIRKSIPNMRAMIVGRSASRLGVDGIEIASDVPDVGAYLRRAKVALVASEGTGSPFKTLEAVANGAAIIARPWAVDCYGMDALRANSADEFAAHAARLLADEELRREHVRAAIPALLDHDAKRVAVRFADVLTKAATAHSSD